MARYLPLIGLLTLSLRAQTGLYDLESISVEGTQVPRETVLAMSGLHIGAKIDKAAFEEACGKLQESGLFADIRYRYKPSSQQGFALTLSLTDQSTLAQAAIEVPGTDENEIWKWLTAAYPAFQHRVPTAGAAQQFLALQIERHLGAALHGKHIVAAMETDMTGPTRNIISFQPDTLPRIASMTFSGEQEIPGQQLEAILRKLIGDRGYTDRSFRRLVEMNLRPAYEEHGLYRVRFPSITIRMPDADSLEVTTTVEEGPKYNHADAQVAGDDLPADALLKAGNFKIGRIANGREIHDGISEMERRLMRMGFLDARAAEPQRAFDDVQHNLTIKIGFRKGPLYHFGEVAFTGLSAELEKKARKVWQAQPGDPYDLLYANDFIQTFAKQTDLHQFRKYSVQTKPGSGDHVKDVTLVFEPR